MASPRRPLRVQLVTTSLMLGGAELQVYHLAVELKRRGHDVSVITMRDPEALADELAQHEIPLHSLSMRSGVADPRGLFRLARAVRSSRPDVVHSHMVHANLLARLCRPLAPMPVLVSTAHSISEGARWRYWAYRLTDPLCSITTNVCKRCVEEFVRVGAVRRERIRYIPNGIDLAAFDAVPGRREEVRRSLGIDEATFLWLAVGYLDTAKDYPTLIEAVRQLASRQPASGERPSREVAVLIAGSGPLRGELEALAREAGLHDDQLRFLGRRSDVADLMRASDAYVMSSAWEGLPTVLLEAGASMLPAVVTDVGGNNEVIVDGENGFVVPPNNAAALSGAMVQLMGLEAHRLEELGHASREHVEANFGLSSVVDRWEALYAEYLPSRAGTNG